MLCSTAISGGKCRLPVINCRAAYKPSCLLFPRKRPRHSSATEAVKGQ